jgi:hypothetical protein
MTDMQAWRAREEGFWSCLKFFFRHGRWPTGFIGQR